MRIAASLRPNIDLEIKDAKNSVERQISQIEQFIEQNVDVLIVSPIKSIPITPVVEKAMNAGIPTIIIDRKTTGRNYTAYLGANNIEVGRIAAKYIISDTKGPTRVIEIKGLQGSSPAYERSLGFRNTLNAIERIELIGAINGNWEKSSVKDKLTQLLDSVQAPDYIFAHNDRMARGVWEVLKSRSLEDKVKIIGVDGLFGPNGGIQMVKAGILEATVLYPTGGAKAIKLASDLLEGESINKNNILSTVVIDSVNVDIMQNQFDKMNRQQNDIEAQQAIIADQIEIYKSQSNLLKLMIVLLALLFVLSFWSIYLVVKLKKSKKRLELTNRKILIQRNQIEKFAQQLKATNETKINFFTALSHEFKAPLTLIMSSVEYMLKGKNKDPENFNYETGLIMNNSKRLLGLINELLDFRKLETGAIQLKPSRTNIYEFLKVIVNEFKSKAIKNSIDLELRKSSKNSELYIDRNMMDKVFFNLLSNSFKFTPKNGKIRIKIEDNTALNTVDIYVKDSGIGIPKAEQDQIFEPFFQASNNIKTSSGMGLYLTRQFIELHKGTISVQIIKGTEFKISLRKGKEHFDTVQLKENDPLKQGQAAEPLSEIEAPEMDTMEASGGVLDNNLNLLIIEDNIDLANLIKKNLQQHYQIIHSDGTNGTKAALDSIPDAIICDLSLPEKSGFEICSELKHDLRTSHIPIIILTALSDQESKIKALKSGADFYITKPFHMEVLEQAVTTVLYNREKLRYYFTNRINEVEEGKLTSSSEQEFLNNLNELIAKNMQNHTFSVEELSNKFGISRVHLYRKVKALLGIRINEYINSQRLLKGRALLQESNLNIAEIAYKVGYSSPGYFSTSFKNKFGVSPKSFQNVKEP